MKLMDIIRFAVRSLSGYPLRTGLTLLAMAIGVASVVVLTSLGEGARRYVAQQFTSLGTHLLIVLPGRSETVGGPPPLLGQTPRDLTLEDAEALLHSSAIGRMAPVMIGSAPVSFGGRSREVTIMGTTDAMMEIHGFSIAQGRFLPKGEITRAESVCVLGHTLRTELFFDEPALGQFVRIGDRRFQVIGLLSKKGQSLGMDTGDMALIPVASAGALFNQASLFRIFVEARDRDAIPRAKSSILSIIKERHEGEDDITVITQDAMLATFDKIFKALTLTVAGIAAISLVVAGILVMNVMLIAVSQRRAEIGLLKAVGAPNRQIMTFFIWEAVLISILGAVVGLMLSAVGKCILVWLFPTFPVTVPTWAPIAAVAVALGTGLLFGTLPARRAAALDPVIALSRR
jgi:putative ABC transport system permease protein